MGGGADDYFAEHNEIRLDGDARSVAYLSIDESPEAEQHLWHVRQIFLDENADGDFRIEADVNLDATQEEGEIIFKNYRVGFVEDLAEIAQYGEEECRKSHIGGIEKNRSNFVGTSSSYSENYDCQFQNGERCVIELLDANDSSVYREGD